MSDLTDFLLERIAEDEEDVRQLFCEPGCEGRVLAECEAKRRIVDRFSAYQVAFPGDFHAGRKSGLGEALLLLASIYADHPDYRQEWRP